MSILKLETLLENQLDATGEVNPQAPHTRLHFASGRTVVVPTALLLEAATPPDANATGSNEESTVITPDDGDRAPLVEPVDGAPQLDEAQVIPLVEERLEVSKRLLEKERIRVQRETEEYAQRVSVPLQQVDWEVEHVPVGQVVTERPETRQVGDVIVFPILEERLVVTTQLYLREEVHLRRVVTTVEKSADFMLKRDILVETRMSLSADEPSPAPATVAK